MQKIQSRTCNNIFMYYSLTSSLYVSSTSSSPNLYPAVYFMFSKLKGHQFADVPAIKQAITDERDNQLYWIIANNGTEDNKLYPA